MPLLLRTDRGDLRLILSNGGEVLDSQLAATPQEANRVAIMIIASRDAFDIGDTLTCQQATEGQDITLAKADRAMKLAFDLPEDQAMALAQMCKRFVWEDAVRFANPHDGGRERDAILEGTLTLQRALREAGFAPR